MASETVFDKEEPRPAPEIDVLTQITDPAFRAYCEYAMDNRQELLYFNGSEYFSHAPWDTDGDGKLSPAEAAAVEGIDIKGYYYDFASKQFKDKDDSDLVRSLAGIGNFTGLILFNCHKNLLTELDMSGCDVLEELYCSHNQLTSLNITRNPKLKKIECSGNKLASLDISKNRELDFLVFINNPGDGLQFNVKAWFDNDSCPDWLTKEGWFYVPLNCNIHINYQKID